MRRLPDGEILSSNIIIDKAPNTQSKFKNNGHHKAIVLRKIPVDDVANIYKKTVEYEIQIVSGARRGEIYRGCRPMDTFGGADNFNEIVFSPKTQVLNGVDKGTSTPPDSTNASYVVVAFLDGLWNSPFIIGGWKQPNNSGHGATIDDGNIVRGQYQNLTWSIDNDGILTIDHSGTSFVLDNVGNITITTTAETTINSTGNTTINSQAEVNISSASNTNINVGGAASISVTGNTTLTSAAVNITGTGAVQVSGASVSLSGASGISFIGPNVTIGSLSATESIILGDLFKTYFDSHSHPAHGAPPSTAMPSSTLSTKSKVE